MVCTIAPSNTISASQKSECTLLRWEWYVTCFACSKVTLDAFLCLFIILLYHHCYHLRCHCYRHHYDRFCHHCYKSIPSWVGMYCKACQGCVSLFVCYQIFSHFSISFCSHLEHCKVRIKFALQHYWITHIEMRRFLEFWNTMEHACVPLWRHDL
jgi:hypothetical protein